MLEVSVPFIVVRKEGMAESDRATCAASSAQAVQLNSELATIEANKNREISNLDMMLMYLFSSVSKFLKIWCKLWLQKIL